VSVSGFFEFILFYFFELFIYFFKIF